MDRRTTQNPDDLRRPDGNELKPNYDKHDVGEVYFIERVNELGLHTEPWGIDMRDDDGGGLIHDDKMDLRLWEPEGDHGPAKCWPSEDFECDFPEVTDDHLVAADGGLPHTHVESWGRITDDLEMKTREVMWTLKGVCDIKTKANRDWMGILNLRHFVHYARWADLYDVPVFLYFTYVDMDEECVGDENILVPLEPFDDYESYVERFDPDSDYSFNVMSNIADDCDLVERTFRAPDGNPVVALDTDVYRDFEWFESVVL